MASMGSNPGNVKLLPGNGGTMSPSAPEAASNGASSGAGTGAIAGPISASSSPNRQLSELPRDELEHLAEEFGLDPSRSKSRQALVAAIHDRRQVIAAMDRDAMLDVVRWGRRPVTVNATREQIALEIVRIRSMRFAGLSQRGLVVLARLRGANVVGNEPVPALVRKLKKQEGWFQRLSRKRRTWIGSMVARMMGEADAAGATDYQFLPPPGGSSGGGGVGVGGGAGGTTSASPRPASVREEIEESGLIGGLTNRIKKSADSYLNQKLDEIEARIDRKLDEIDRRLAEWRDKEIANRIRILKITLWASVIVSAISLIYSYVSIYIWPKPSSPAPSRPVPARVVPSQK